MDPITIATASFAAIKTGVSLGKDLQSLTADIGKMWGAIDEIKDAHSSEKSKRRGSVEEDALTTFMAKKKAEDMEDALRLIIYSTRGVSGWHELVRLRAEIRKQRLEEKQQQAHKMAKIREIIFAAILVIIFGGISVFFIWVVLEAKRARG